MYGMRHSLRFQLSGTSQLENKDGGLFDLQTSFFTIVAIDLVCDSEDPSFCCMLKI